MKAAILTLLLIPCIAVAAEVRGLGKSPDGTFELILKAEKADAYGWVAVKTIRSGKVSETETAQGYSNFRSDDVHASWKTDSTAFAVGVRGTKTTTETDVYIKDGEVWEKLEFPPFIANILGRQGVFSKGRNQNVDFAGFEGDARFALICHVEPDFQQKDEADKIANWQPSQQTDWKVVLEYPRRIGPHCVIVSIEPYTETKSESADAGHPAPRPQDKPEEGVKTQPETEGRSRLP